MSDTNVRTEARNSAPLMELRQVEAGYGPFRALFDVSLTIGPGRVVALLGSNGAGKTTIARVCSGLISPTSGKLMFEGNDVTGTRPYKIARLGVAHAPEGRS
ncbi:MAG: ATP-binding cassette domain-containing protein, partial [Actinobacteria bacterium]|nr:ATP-binding cassette domain-containing protein [Actinomycetota bacterium]